MNSEVVLSDNRYWISDYFNYNSIFRSNFFEFYILEFSNYRCYISELCSYFNA